MSRAGSSRPSAWPARSSAGAAMHHATCQAPQTSAGARTLHGTRALKLRPTAVLNEEKKGEAIPYDARRAAFTILLEGYGVRVLRIR